MRGVERLTGKPRKEEMNTGKPKAVCCECSEPIYDNVSGPPVRVTCGGCVQRRLFFFSKETRLLGVRLKEAREAAGFSQRSFSVAMECSPALVNLIEKGERKPTSKMREFMLSVSTTKQTTCEEGLK